MKIDDTKLDRLLAAHGQADFPGEARVRARIFALQEGRARPRLRLSLAFTVALVLIATATTVVATTVLQAHRMAITQVDPVLDNRGVPSGDVNVQLAYTGRTMLGEPYTQSELEGSISTRRTHLADARSVLPIEPIIPAYVPAGYSLQGIDVMQFDATGRYLEATNIAYAASGYHSLIIRQEYVGPDAAIEMQTGLGVATTQAGDHEVIKLLGGKDFTQVRSYIWLSGDYEFFLSGTVGEAEALKVIESMP